MKMIGEKLTAYFKSLGITQEDIAERLGVSQQYVSRLLSGNAEFGKKQAQRFYELWKIQPSWLLTGQGEMIATSNENDEMQTPRDLSDADAKFREYVYIKDAQIDELLRQNGKLIKIIEMLTEKLK